MMLPYFSGSEDIVFKLHDEFVDKYKGRQPKWGPIGYITYLRTYSRIKEDGEHEEFVDTVRRVVEGIYSIQRKHCAKHKLPWSQRKAHTSAEHMFDLIWNFKFTPPGRGFWMMGTPLIYEKGSAALQNCAFVSTEDITTDFSDPFATIMDLLMLGVGCSSDTKGADKITIRQPRVDGVYVVEDSREGWCDTIRTVMDPYSGKGALPDNIDYSKIRKKGTPLKTFGGISGGPQPLIDCVESIKSILNKAIGRKLSSTDIVDIIDNIGKAVVSGNVRRSAILMIGAQNDPDFLELKDPKLHKDELYSYRWASNNSISGEIGMDYSEISNHIATNGEPGVLWLDNARQYSRMNGVIDNKDYRVNGVNPCGEMFLDNYELCNLVETYPAHHETLDEWIDTLKYAYMYAKTVTLIPTHNEKINAVMLRNRRIGVSISGISQAFTKFGKRALLNAMDKGYSRLRELDKIYSDWLCIPMSIKLTTIKPSGTVSLLSGATPGVHYPISEFYIRNVRFQENSHLLEDLDKSGYPIEKDKYSSNTVVVSFPVKETHFSRSIKDVTMWEQLETVSQIQKYWSDNGLSATITVKENEKNNIKDALELYEDKLKGVSFLPESHGYEQAPIIPISEEEYNNIISRVKTIKVDTVIHETTDEYCDSDKCTLTIKKE